MEKVVVSPLSIDCLPPHDSSAECAAIACAILDPQIAPELKTDWFYDFRYKTAADVLLEMAANGKAIDPGTVAQRLTSGGMADAKALVDQCINQCHSTANFPYWRDILLDKFTLRRIVQTAQRAIARVYESAITKPVDLLDEFEREALAIRQQADGGNDNEADIHTTLLDLVADYEQAHVKGKPRGLATGFNDLDRLLGGLKPQQFLVIAARPSVGKTALALNIAERVSVQDRLPVGFFSLEMSAKELLHRLACSRARIDGMKLNEGRASDEDIKALITAHAEIAKAPLFICDRGGLTLAQLFARSRIMLQRRGIKLLIVDYLGLLRCGEKGRSRYEETTLISNGLKALAKELRLPVLALAQLNRDSDREGREPRLSDLRDSGSIEQDADCVALLHREERDATNAGQSVRLILAKQRSGRTGIVNLVFIREYTRFESTA